jgi:hypothetical protein
MKGGSAAKRFRQKSAVKRLENNIKEYTDLISKTKDEDELKKFGDKVKKHTLTIENTNKKISEKKAY